MKKLLFVVLSLIISVVDIKAQASEGDAFVIPKIGANYSNFLNRSSSYKPGFTGVLGIEYFINKKLAWDTEMYFTHQGAHDVMYYPENANYDYSLNLLNLDFLLKYYPITALKQHFSLYTGFHTGYIVYARANYQDIKDDIKAGQYGIPVGATIEFGKLIIDARYIYSFRKIAGSEDSKTKQIIGDATLNSFWLTFGYKIQIF